MDPSYGDSTNSVRGRARVPGPADGHDGRVAGYDQYGGYTEAARPTAAAGRASTAAMGNARVGRASVRPGGGYQENMDPGGYGSPTGYGTVPNGQGAAGRATVGRATVGRATVGRPLDAPMGPGGPAGPGGPDGPGGPGGPGRPPIGRGGRGGKPRSKKARRRNLLLSAFAVMIMLVGLLVVGGTYYYDSVPAPDQLTSANLPQSTTVYYSDGTTVMAKLGTVNRTAVPIDQISKDMQHAMVAAEDNSFYTNSGVDIKGIVRAAWNNVTGGSRQGASTITQQVARQVVDLKGITYARKLREAVIAMKIDQTYSKDVILGMYLNVTYFGRGAYGIEAASQAYFGKPAAQLNAAEAMVLAGLVKQPEGADGFDPGRNLDNAKARWENYTKPNMVKLHYLTQADADKLQFPTNFKPYTNGTSSATSGLDKPTGLVVQQVVDELSKVKDAQGKQVVPNVESGGYKIVTTIDPKMEQAAINAASAGVKGSPMTLVAKTDQAALVAVEPGTGRVLAYYGGDDGTGTDFAGTPHPPGSTFKLYTLAAALQKGYSIDSYWDGSASRQLPGRLPGQPVRNAGGEQPCGKSCTLQVALKNSLNTVYYAVGAKLGDNDPAKGATAIIDMAKAMGIRAMWTDKLQRVDLTSMTAAQANQQGLGLEVSIGQYGITPLDHADGVATLAARGVHADPHFVLKVTKGKDLVYSEVTKQTRLTDPNNPLHMTSEQLDDEIWASSTVVAGTKNALANGRASGAKTGTWQRGTSSTENAHAWFVGFTPQLASAVWVGNKKDELALKDKNGGNMFGSTTPGDIWKKFMDAALNGKPKLALPQPKHVGDPTLGDGVSPAPTHDPQPDPNNPFNPFDPNQQQPGTQPTDPFGRGGQAGGQGGGLGVQTLPPTG